MNSVDYDWSPIIDGSSTVDPPAIPELSQIGAWAALASELLAQLQRWQKQGYVLIDGHIGNVPWQLKIWLR